MSMSKRFTFGLILLMCFLSIGVCSVWAEENRPRIGLALGGGSAKGFAHIGVIQWLEEHRIPVDYVAGTSMGGLMGGCYAMGMETDEICQLAEQMQWEKVFTSVPPYDILNFRRKEDRRDYMIEAQVGRSERSVGLPSGVTSYPVDFMLSRLALAYSTIDNFAELPLPYRCTATDLVRSELVVLDQGSLVEAMRSTMSIPGIFAPVRQEGRILVDGGVLNNLPADVVREMGADVVIAVNLSAGKELSAINGADDVLMRTITTVIIANSRRGMEAADVAVEPRLNGLSSMDWGKMREFIKMGYEAAEMQSDFLSALAVDEETWREWKRNRQDRRRTKILVPAGIEVSGTSEDHVKQILKRLSKHVGIPLNLDALEKDLRDLIGTGRFESFRYEYTLRQGEPFLRIIVVEKPYKQPFVDMAFLLEADSVRAEHVEINARTRLTWFDLLGEGSEARLDLGFGTELHLLAELYKPFGDSSWFIAPALFLDQNSSHIFRDGTRVTDYKTTQSGLVLDLGYSFGYKAEARLGYGIGYQDINLKIGEALAEELDGSMRWMRLKWVYNNADDPILPRRGTHWESEIKWFSSAPAATDPFGLAESTLILNFPAKDRDKTFFRLSAGSSFGGDSPLAQEYKLGGPFRLGTYGFDEFHGENYLLGNVGYLKYLFELPLTGRGVYLGWWLEFGDVFDDWSEVDLELALSTGIICPTVFGPIYLGASYGNGANEVFYLGVGKIF